MPMAMCTAHALLSSVVKYVATNYCKLDVQLNHSRASRDINVLKKTGQNVFSTMKSTRKGDPRAVLFHISNMQVVYRKFTRS